MSAVPMLVKKLKGIRAAGKLSKAMKTVSAANYAKLSVQVKQYAVYAAQVRALFGETESGASGTADTVVVFGSDRGFCGGFNIELLQFLKNNTFAEGRPAHLIVMGDKMGKVLSENGIEAETVLAYDAVPPFSAIEPLYAHLTALSEGQTDKPVTLVYPAYKNTMTQIPTQTVVMFRPTRLSVDRGDLFLFPDEETILTDLSERSVRSALYGILLETALGAQATTMMTMRSAYDTASAFAGDLTRQIQRQRQNDVTSDVLETSADVINREKGAQSNG